MSWRLDNRRKWILLGLAALALLLQALLDATRAPVRQSDYDLKLAAAERAAEAFAVLRTHRQLNDAQLDLLNDPAGTGLIGPEFSQITNAQGNLEAKLTSLNPNWTGVLVDYFRRAGLEPGDPVAVAVSGSFPGLNIALFAAMETLRLRPVVVTSIVASMWGANDPAFTWLDMESVLFEAGVFTTRSSLASFGGGNDMGRGLSPDGRRLIVEAAEQVASLPADGRVVLVSGPSSSGKTSFAKRLEIQLQFLQGNKLKDLQFWNSTSLAFHMQGRLPFQHCSCMPGRLSGKQVP